MPLSQIFALAAFAAAAATVTARADLVINEIMYHPSSELAAEEYLELHNTGAGPLNVSGWRLTKGVNFSIPTGTPRIPAGGYLVIAADSAAFVAKYPAVSNYVAGWTGRLSNASDTIVIENAAGTLIDEVGYADDGDWAVRERGDLDDGHRGWRWRSEA